MGLWKFVNCLPFHSGSKRLHYWNFQACSVEFVWIKLKPILCGLAALYVCLLEWKFAFKFPNWYLCWQKWWDECTFGALLGWIPGTGSLAASSKAAKYSFEEQSESETLTLDIRDQGWWNVRWAKTRGDSLKNPIHHHKMLILGKK